MDGEHEMDKAGPRTLDHAMATDNRELRNVGTTALDHGVNRDAVGVGAFLDVGGSDLRHEALSRLAERGDFTVLELAAVSGHRTLQMLKRYTHLQASKLAEKIG